VQLQAYLGTLNNSGIKIAASELRDNAVATKKTNPAHSKLFS